MKNYLNLLITILISVFSVSAFADKNQYVIFVDAGSSGSRLHVFQYEKNQPIPVIKDIFSESTKPGLSSFVDHEEDAGVSLKILLNDATQALRNVGADLHSVSVNVLATAGMRLLVEEKQKTIYANVIQYIKNNYEFSIGDIKTIDGQMEALYGWLDVNYLLENFQNHQPTVGSIDMGGASTQIAFATNDKRAQDDVISVTLNDQNYKVFTKSFLGLGLEQAGEAMKLNPAAANCFPQYFNFSKSGMGDFNMASCSAIYADIIGNQQVTEKIMPVQDQSFIAYSGIYFTYNFFNTEKTPDQASLEASIQNVCYKTWQQLQDEYPRLSEKFLSTYCANGVYENQLIYKTYKIRGSQLMVANQINQTDIDWTLGAALHSLLKGP